MARYLMLALRFALALALCAATTLAALLLLCI
jgi:hypothetical protein